MTDILVTIILIIACIAMIALSAILIYDLSREFIEDQRAAKRRDELIKNWSKLDLTNPCIYIDTDTEYYRGGLHTTCHTWSNMRVACRHFNNTSSVNRCVYPDNDVVQHCSYSTCPLLHATERSKGIDSKRADK